MAKLSRQTPGSNAHRPPRGRSADNGTKSFRFSRFMWLPSVGVAMFPANPIPPPEGAPTCPLFIGYSWSQDLSGGGSAHPPTPITVDGVVGDSCPSLSAGGSGLAGGAVGHRDPDHSAVGHSVTVDGIANGPKSERKESEQI